MGKRVVLTLSFVVAAVAFAAAILFHRSDSPIPLWDKVAMTYGGVFSVFWFFDTAGKKVAKKFSEDDDEPVRPSPHPSSDPRRRPVLPGDGDNSAESHTHAVSDTTHFAQRDESDNDRGIEEQSLSHISADYTGLSLDRVRSSQVSQWQDMLDSFAVEVLALDGVQPDTGGDGHVTLWRADKLLNRQECYSFWIQLNGERIGTVSANQMQMRTGKVPIEKVPIEQVPIEKVPVRLEFIYVKSAWRRKGIASAVLEKLIEFLLMIHESCELHCAVSGNNYRGRSYLQACGFIPLNHSIANNDLGTDGPLELNSKQSWLRIVP